MANVTVDTLIAFSKAVILQYRQKCRTSVLALNPEDKVYTPKAGITRVREVNASGAGDYTGVYQSVGGSSSVTYRDYKATVDRFKQFVIDYLDEVASYTEGATPSIVALADDFINRYLASEIDAFAIASIVAAIPVGNKFTNAQLATDKNGIWNTLLDIQGKCFDAGVDSDVEVFVFVRNEIFQNMQKYILEKNGLANNAMLRNRTVIVDLGVEEIAEPLSITTNVIQFNNLTIIPMANDRMNTEIELYDGTTEGQTEGGWAPSDTSKKVDIVAVPAGAGFVDTRYQVLNYIVPAISAEAQEIDAGVNRTLNKVLGDVVIENIGVNQKANAYELDCRFVYNAELFDIRKNACFAVTAV